MTRIGARSIVAPMPKHAAKTVAPPGLIGPVSLDPSNQPLPELAMLAACGFPSPAEDFFRPEDRLDLNEHLIRNPPATFICRADAGASMVDYGIGEGDYLVVDRSIDAQHGHIVVVLWEGGFTLKKLWIKDGRVELHASGGHRPIRVGEGAELEIWGVVLWSIRRQAR